MSIRFYNPPHVLLARGDREGADIGGALSIVAMDKKHQLHVVGNIFSELSHGIFFKEEGLEDVFNVPIDQAITVAFGIHIIQYVIGCLLGLIELGRESLSLSWLRTQAATQQDAGGQEIPAVNQAEEID